jgi:ArpU family phage transcriptional regulator
MRKDAIIYVEGELKAYKRNKSIYQGMLLENNISISAQFLSDMPKSVTNKFSSMTENQALSNRLYELEKDIRRVDSWIEHLLDEERFVVNNHYMENRSYNVIAHRWNTLGNPLYSAEYWKIKRKKALHSICQIFVSSFV